MSIYLNNGGVGGSSGSTATVDTSNLVPYIGATSDVVLGVWGMSANSLSIATDAFINNNLFAQSSTINALTLGTESGPLIGAGGNVSAGSTGNLTVNSPLSIDQARQLLGGAAVISIDTSSFISQDVLYSKSMVIPDPTSTSDYIFWRVPHAITLSGMHLLVSGASGDTCIGSLSEYDAQGASGLTCTALVTATAGTNSTTSSFLNATIDAGDYIGWNTSAGTGSSICITIDYMID